MKDLMNVLKNVFTFTKNEIKVILFITAVIAAGYSVKYYNFYFSQNRTADYDYSVSDSIFKERTLKIYAGSNRENRSLNIEQSLYNELSASEDSVRRSEKIRVENEVAEFTVDINTAGIDELTELPGIGESIAGRITEYRDKNKRFGNINELMKVKGIGRKKFEKLKKYIKAD